MTTLEFATMLPWLLLGVGIWLGYQLIRQNGRPVRAMDAVGSLNAVLFSPEDIELMNGAPAARRRYLDLTISQIDPPYLRALSRFNRVLEQRNSLLKSLAGSGVGAGSRRGSCDAFDRLDEGVAGVYVYARVAVGDGFG